MLNPARFAASGEIKLKNDPVSISRWTSVPFSCTVTSGWVPAIVIGVTSMTPILQSA